MALELSSFRKALAALQRGLARSDTAPDDEELRDACIQRFEVTFELAWRMVKRRLELDAPDAATIDALSYRGLMRRAAEQALLDDPVAWFDWREYRNLTSHTYDAAKAARVRAALPAFAAAAQQLLERLERAEHGDG